MLGGGPVSPVSTPGWVPTWSLLAHCLEHQYVRQVILIPPRGGSHTWDCVCVCLFIFNCHPSDRPPLTPLSQWVRSLLLHLNTLFILFAAASLKPIIACLSGYLWVGYHPIIDHRAIKDQGPQPFLAALHPSAKCKARHKAHARWHDV